jgi:hypothetical protein
MRWQEAAPGLERAKCVMAPFKLDGTNPDLGHCDYVRMLHATRYGGTYKTFGYDPETDLDIRGRRSVLLTVDDSHTRTRIISAERVESAVEVATFFDICADEGMFSLRYPDGFWVVGHLPFGVREGKAKTLRGAYLNYHKAAKEES